MSKQFALEQTGGDGGTVELDKGTLFATAMIMKSASDQLFSRAGLAQQEDRRIAGRDFLDQFQNALQCRTVPMDLLEIDLAANLFFEIYILPGDLLFEFGDFTIGKRILDRDRYLARCLTKKIGVIFAKEVFVSAGKAHYAEPPSTVD